MEDSFVLKRLTPNATALMSFGYIENGVFVNGGAYTILYDNLDIIIILKNWTDYFLLHTPTVIFPKNAVK